MRSNRSAIAPANGAIRPMISAGTVSTIGTSTSTPATAANSAWICGRTGAMSTAPSTDMQLAASSRISCARPAGRPVAGSTTAVPAVAAPPGTGGVVGLVVMGGWLLGPEATRPFVLVGRLRWPSA